MLCFNVCDHFYCLGFQWQLLYVIWKWLLCFDLPQELISESFLYTLIALVFHKFVFCVPVLCVNLGDHLFYLSVMLSVPTLPPRADTQCLMPITPKPISIQSKKDYWIRSSLFPWLNSMLLHGYAPFYRFYLWTYIQSVQREGTMESEPYLSKETVYNQTIFSHDAQHVWCFPDARRHWAPMSLVQKHFQIIYGTQINLVTYEQSYWQII